MTITPPPAPTVTVTEPSTGPGQVGPAGCSLGQNCKVTNLIVPVDGRNATGINLQQGQVEVDSLGDLNFQVASDGTPELTRSYPNVYSLEVTAQDASKQQCQNATNTAPDANPITNFIQTY